MNPPPLCVDLDGTLIKTDMLFESMAKLITRRPWYLFAVPVWFLRGRAYLKRQLAERVQIDVTGLPYHDEFLQFLRAEKTAGRQLILATASHRHMADPIAAHVGLFDEVVATEDHVNLRSQAKAIRLTEKFGEFDYAGNSSADQAVWRAARQAIVVGNSQHPANEARAFRSVDHPLKHLFRLLRPRYWLINLIVFIPALIPGNTTSLRPTALAFLALCLCASGLSVWNDLRHLEADRHRATARCRPFAAGQVALSTGLILILLLLAGAVALVAFLPGWFTPTLVGYAGLIVWVTGRTRR